MSRDGLKTLTLKLMAVVCLVTHSWAAKPGNDWDEASLEQVDYQSLLKVVRHPGPGMADLARSGFRFIYMNQLNRARFAVQPPADEVAGSVVKIIRLSDSLLELSRRGRQLAATDPGVEQERLFAQQVGDTAKQIRKSFERYFLEMQGSSVVINVPNGEARRTTLLFYSLQVDRISKQLARHLDQYFFPENPGSIQVADFQRASVAAMTEALVQLSELTRKRLK